MGRKVSESAAGRPRVGWSRVAAVWVLAAACSGGGGGDEQGAEEEKPSGQLRDEVCRLLDRFDESEEALAGPEVFGLDEAALADVLKERRDLLDQLVEATDGGLRTLLEERAEVQPVADEAWVNAWDEERARLADAHTVAWVEEAVGTELTGADDEDIDEPAYWISVRTGYERLVVGCRAPELAHGPVQETSENPPPGQLAYYRPPDRESDEQGGHVFVANVDGTDERELTFSEAEGLTNDPSQWLPSGGNLEAAPGTVPKLLLNVWDGEEHAMVDAFLDGAIVDIVQRSSEGGIYCPGWDSPGLRVLAATEAAEADERRVLLLDLTRETPSGPVELPFATASCSDFVTDDRIVVSGAAMDLDDDTAVWTVGLDGSDPDELYRARGCSTQVGGVDPHGRRVALAQTCLDPLDNGILVVDLSSGESQRVATGTAALPKWSPDGEWLTFGFSPVGEGPRLGTWIARPDGHQLRKVVASPAWYPVWLPPD
jgi:hypothetical protein